jgi:hypothetical protein
MCSEMGAREIIESDVVGECGVHGLFWDDTLDHPAKDEDCPTCIAETDERFQRERDRNERGDRRYHEGVDRDLVEFKNGDLERDMAAAEAKEDR